MYVLTVFLSFVFELCARLQGFVQAVDFRSIGAGRGLATNAFGGQARVAICVIALGSILDVSH